MAEPGKRLPADEIERLMADWPESARSLARAARDVVLAVAPGVSEKVAFGALCYYKAGAPYGVIGGNVCMLDARGAELSIGFLHGASLPDPEGLLKGEAKAKREFIVRESADLTLPALAALIRAAVDFDPSESGS